MAKDGQHYTEDEFIAHYGSVQGPRQWVAALPCASGAAQPTGVALPPPPPLRPPPESTAHAAPGGAAQPAHELAVVPHVEGVFTPQQGETLRRTTQGAHKKMRKLLTDIIDQHSVLPIEHSVPKRVDLFVPTP